MDQTASCLHFRSVARKVLRGAVRVVLENSLNTTLMHPGVVDFLGSPRSLGRYSGMTVRRDVGARGPGAQNVLPPQLTDIQTSSQDPSRSLVSGEQGRLLEFSKVPKSLQDREQRSPRSPGEDPSRLCSGVEQRPEMPRAAEDLHRAIDPSIN